MPNSNTSISTTQVQQHAPLPLPHFNPTWSSSEQPPPKTSRRSPIATSTTESVTLMPQSLTWQPSLEPTRSQISATDIRRTMQSLSAMLPASAGAGSRAAMSACSNDMSFFMVPPPAPAPPPPFLNARAALGRDSPLYSATTSPLYPTNAQATTRAMTSAMVSNQTLLPFETSAAGREARLPNLLSLAQSNILNRQREAHSVFNDTVVPSLSAAALSAVAAFDNGATTTTRLRHEPFQQGRYFQNSYQDAVSLTEPTMLSSLQRGLQQDLGRNLGSTSHGPVSSFPSSLPNDHDSQGLVPAASPLVDARRQFVPTPTMVLAAVAEAAMPLSTTIPAVTVTAATTAADKASTADDSARFSTRGLRSRSDDLALSQFQVYLRRHIQVFAATAEDVGSSVRGRTRKIRLHQIGLRCRHCAHIPPPARAQGSTYFPIKAIGFYQAAQNMSSTHLQCGVCPEMPDADKEMFARLLGTKAPGSNSRQGRRYWSKHILQMGLVNTDHGVFPIHFVPIGTVIQEDNDSLVSKTY